MCIRDRFSNIWTHLETLKVVWIYISKLVLGMASAPLLLQRQPHKIHTTWSRHWDLCGLQWNPREQLHPDCGLPGTPLPLNSQGPWIQEAQCDVFSSLTLLFCFYKVLTLHPPSTDELPRWLQVDWGNCWPILLSIPPKGSRGRAPGSWRLMDRRSPQVVGLRECRSDQIQVPKNRNAITISYYL